MVKRTHGKSLVRSILGRSFFIHLFSSLLEYFMNLGLSTEEASELQWKYYRKYGLPLRGLVLHHNVGG